MAPGHLAVNVGGGEPSLVPALAFAALMHQRTALAACRPSWAASTPWITIKARGRPNSSSLPNSSTGTSPRAYPQFHARDLVPYSQKVRELLVRGEFQFQATQVSTQNRTRQDRLHSLHINLGRGMQQDSKLQGLVFAAPGAVRPAG